MMKRKERPSDATPSWYFATSAAIEQAITARRT